MAATEPLVNGYRVEHGSHDRLHDVLCISSIDWDFIWQGHQEIMSSLAADGRRVLFLENTGVRPLRFRDLPRLRRRLRNWSKGPGGFREERPNLFVLSPIVLPGPYSRIATRINRFLLLRSIRRWHFGTNDYERIQRTYLAAFPRQVVPARRCQDVRPSPDQSGHSAGRVRLGDGALRGR